MGGINSSSECRLEGNMPNKTQGDKGWNISKQNWGAKDREDTIGKSTYLEFQKENDNETEEYSK